MKSFAALALIALTFSATAATKNVADKERAVASIEKRASELTALSDEVWRYAETALRETRSSKALADYAEQNGFKVTRGAASMPTAFVAEFGSGKPVIGIMGEFDALPGISQKAQPAREALEAGAAGHGCGHNLFGVGSLAAAISVKELIAAGKLDGTVKFFGTPAEEAVGGKIYMLRDGVMNGVDVMLAWHPGDRTGADTESTQALVDIRIDFQGRAAHAAFDPWNGRSAADGAELFTHAVNMMREHIRPGARMHYVITTAGDVPNVVPEKATVWMWIRDTERSGVEEMLGRVRKIAQGAALAADVESSLSLNGGDWNMLVNLPGQRVLQSNLEWLGPLSFTNEEQEFAKQIQRAANVAPKGLRTQLEPFENKVKPPTGGSTDVADISWNIPTINLTVTTAPEEAPWHGWPVVACGGMSIGHKGMLYAAKALAATMIDLYRDPNAVAAMQREFAELTRGVDYQPYIPDGPPHLPPGR